MDRHKSWTVAFEVFETGRTFLSGLADDGMARPDAVREAGEMNFLNYVNKGTMRYFPVPLPTVLS